MYNIHFIRCTVYNAEREGQKELRHPISPLGFKAQVAWFHILQGIWACSGKTMQNKKGKKPNRLEIRKIRIV